MNTSDETSLMQKLVQNKYANFAGIAAAAFSVYQLFYATPQVDKNEVSYVTVPIVMRDSEEEPIEGVKVQFTTEGAPESKVTNTDGFVEIDIPETDNIKIVFKHEDFKTINRTLDLKKDPKETKIYYMERTAISQ